MDIQEVERDCIESDSKVEMPTRGKGFGQAKGIPLEDILELRRKDLTLKQISVILGCSEANVHKRLKGFAPVQVKIDRYKRHRADLLTLTQANIHDSITPSVINEASLLQRSSALKIFNEAERFERGQSTQNINSHQVIESRPDLQLQVNAALLALNISPREKERAGGGG